MRLATFARLGWSNVARVGSYRLNSRLGLYRWTTPIRAAIRGPFFDWSAAPTARTLPAGIDAAAWAGDARRVLSGELPTFSDRWQAAGFPPDWNRSVITGVQVDPRGAHWSRVERFVHEGGDIKGFWEPGRFDGLLILAQGWIATGSEELRAAIERWLSEFCAVHPANSGVQWHCGQETSLRLMHVLLVADLLERWGGVRALPALHEFADQHCRRIAATLGYAVGQDNNHGTSEAAALFIAGAFLARGAGASAKAARGWCDSGRARLEERVARLVMRDGSFAQYSTNYHRLLLETLSLCEYFRRRLGQSAFSPAFHERCRLATDWLAAMTDPASGSAPNLGANDGARFLPLHRLPYEDMRPTNYLAAATFGAAIPSMPDAAREAARWLGVTEPAGVTAPPRRSRLFADGGFATLVDEEYWLLMRLPVFRFRPSQSDVLHLDLWHRGENMLRDGGTFSYRTDEDTYTYFQGVRSHNTVQFDGREQMPRLSHFLFGAWPAPSDLSFDPGQGRVRAGYVDSHGARHSREVRLDGAQVSVRDDVGGFADRAVLRWRLRGSAEAWSRDGNSWYDGTTRISLHTDAGFARLEMVTGLESRRYGSRAPLAVIEAEVRTASTLTTTIVRKP